MDFPNSFLRGIKRPYLIRNPIISRVLAGVAPFQLLTLVDRVKSFSSIPIAPPSTPNQRPFVGTTPPSRAQAPSPVYGENGFPYSGTMKIRDKIIISILDEDWVSRNPLLEKQQALDFIPTSVSYSPISNMVPIKIIGANNPPYHYGGSEDTLVVKVDWYGYVRQTILEKCRFIESLCKADGRAAGPPTVFIDWAQGSAYEFHEFIVIKAPYTIRDFVGKKRGSNGRVEDYHLGAIHGDQTITLKRVSSTQLTHQEIRRY